MFVIEYEEKAVRTLLNEPDFQITPEQVMLVWNAVGLGGEAGEVLELVKKHVFHQQPLDIEKFEKELGDVLWYLNALCKKAGTTLEIVMSKNIQKLEARFPNGYNAADTTNRAGMAA